MMCERLGMRVRGRDAGGGRAAGPGRGLRHRLDEGPHRTRLAAERRARRGTGGGRGLGERSTGPRSRASRWNTGTLREDAHGASVASAPVRDSASGSTSGRKRSATASSARATRANSRTRSRLGVLFGLWHGATREPSAGRGTAPAVRMDQLQRAGTTSRRVVAMLARICPASPRDRSSRGSPTRTTRPSRG